WALPAAEDSFSFHFAHDRVDSTDSARSSHFGDIPAYTTEGSYGDAVITLASASPNEPQHDHHNMAPAADHFTFDHEPIHASAAAAPIGDAATMPPGSTVDPVASPAASAATTVQLAENESGNEASHGQLPHESHAASEPN